MLLLILLLAVLCVSPARVGAATPSAVEFQAGRTLDLIYNMEFEAGLKAAQAIINASPGHPAGYFYQAAAYWQWRLVTRQPARRRAFLEQFDAAIRQTIRVSERLPETHAAEAAFYLGAAHGMQARMHVVNKQYFKAVSAAKKGGAYLQRCVEIDAAWHDAYFGLGLYHYYLTRVPGIMRGMVQLLMHMQGDRARGLRELEQARIRGALASAAAAAALASIYATPDEKQYHKAHTLLQDLVERYPNNFDYRFRLLFVSLLMHYWPQAHRIGQALEQDIGQGKPYYSPAWLPLIHYRRAETYLFQARPAAALPLLQRLRTQALDGTLRAWVLLRLGNVRDLQGDHERAQAYYTQVQDDDTARQLAAQYTATPFTTDVVILKPLARTI